MDFFGSFQGVKGVKNDHFNTSDGLFWVVSPLFLILSSVSLEKAEVYVDRVDRETYLVSLPTRFLFHQNLIKVSSM